MVWRAVLGVALAGAVGALAAFAASVGSTSRPAGIPSDAQLMVVAEVRSGDTIVLVSERPGAQVPGWGDITARLIGVGAPQSPDECFGPESRAALGAALPLGSVAWVTTDVRANDPAGDWLLYVWTPEGVLLNEALASAGLARPIAPGDNRSFWPAIAQAGEHAARRGTGLWAECG